MDDFILLDGDLAAFLPNFGLATVIVQPGKLKGSGSCSLNGKKVCVEGDEQQLRVPGCAYSTGVHSVPGTGTLKISSLSPDQKSQYTVSGGKAVLLKGSTFRATFEVTSPAVQPTSGIPDANREYSGSGRFVTINVALKTL